MEINSYLQKIKLESLTYVISTIVFFIFTVLYSYFLTNKSRLEIVLDAYVNGEGPYWTMGLALIYYMTALLIYIFYHYNKKSYLINILHNILIYVPSIMFYLGSSISGIMFATAIFLYINPEETIVFSKFLLATISFFSMLFILGSAATFVSHNLNESLSKYEN